MNKKIKKFIKWTAIIIGGLFTVGFLGIILFLYLLVTPRGEFSVNEVEQHIGIQIPSDYSIKENEINHSGFALDADYSAHVILIF